MGAGSVGDLCLDLKEEREGTRRPRGRSLSKTAILLFDNGIVAVSIAIAIATGLVCKPVQECCGVDKQQSANHGKCR